MKLHRSVIMENILGASNCVLAAINSSPFLRSDDNIKNAIIQFVLLVVLLSPAILYLTDILLTVH